MSKYRFLFKNDPSMMGFAQKYLNPVNGQSLDFDSKPEQGQIFYRTSLKTRLIFMGSDYSFLRSIDSLGYRCTTSQLVISKLCNGIWKDIWIGKFGFSLFTVNDNDCRIEFTPDINDSYTCLMENGSDDKNILDITNIKTVHSPNVLHFEYITCVENMTACAVAGNPCTDYVYCDMVQALGTFNAADGCLPGPGVYQLYSTVLKPLAYPVVESTSVWFREVRNTLDVGGQPSTPAGSGWVDQGAITYAGKPGHKWSRIPYDGAYTAPSYYTLWAHLPSNPCLQEAHWVDPNPVVIDYTRGRTLSDVLQFLLAAYNCFTPAKTLVSDLFRINSSLNPGDPDYVTGVSSKITNIIVSHKSDVKNPVASEPAYEAMVSWFSMMEYLRGMFQVYWKVMPSGEVRVEHLKWFIKNNGLDTTKVEYSRYVNRSLQYSFKRDELPNTEHYEMMEQGNIDFVGKDILYKSICVNPDAKSGKVDIRVAKVTTDTEFIQTDPLVISNEGLVMMATTPHGDGTYDIMVENGVLTGFPFINATLSWANLHDAYHKWGRVLPSGIMNGNNTNFDSWIRTKRQDPISIPFCCEEIDFNDLVKSQLGWGEVESASFNTQTEKLKLGLLHY